MTKTEFPLFFSKNIINSEQDEFILTTNGDIVDWCLDYNKNTKWIGEYTSDALDEIIEIHFKNSDGYNEPRTFDALMLFEMNLKAYKIQYQNWLGSVWGNWTDITETIETINSEKNKIVTFNSINAWRVKIFMDSTFPADNHKTIRDFILCEEKFICTMPMDIYNVKNNAKIINQRMYNGAGYGIKSYDKYAAKIGFKQISEIERNKLKEIYDKYNNFIWIPEPYDQNEDDYKLSDFYLVKWLSPWNEKYFTVIKGAGYNIDINYEEI
jgi:hypothetical protein